MAAPGSVWTTSATVPPGRTHAGATDALTGTLDFQGSFIGTGPVLGRAAAARSATGEVDGRAAGVGRVLAAAELPRVAGWSAPDGETGARWIPVCVVGEEPHAAARTTTSRPTHDRARRRM
jgi:hypothetical protein